MKTKQILSLLLAGLMLLPLTACGDTAADTPKTDAETTAAAIAADDAVTAEETTAAEYVKPDTDLGGATFLFSSLEQPNPSWTARTYIEASRPEQNGDIINDAIYERLLNTEETLGITVESVIYNDVNTMLNATMAGDHYADCVLINGNALRTALPKELLTDLYDVTTLDLSKSWWDQNSVDGFSISGHLYAAAGDISPMGLLSCFATYVNKGILKNYNLDDPYELVRDGLWTIDAMEEYGRAVASDLNGDGVMDGNDIFGLSSEALGFVTVTACGVKVTEKDEDDLPYLAINEERCATAVEKIVTLFRNKDITLFATDFSKNYNNVFREFITEMFIADQLLFINNWMVVSLELRNMDSDFGILPPFKLNESQEDYVTPNSETWTTYATVPKTAVDLDMIGHVMNALGYYGQQTIRVALIDRTITDKALRDTDTEEMLDILYSHRRYDLAAVYDWGGVNAFLTAFINNNKTDFASSYAASQEKIVASIEETIVALGE